VPDADGDDADGDDADGDDADGDDADGDADGGVGTLIVSTFVAAACASLVIVSWAFAPSDAEIWVTGIRSVHSFPTGSRPPKGQFGIRVHTGVGPNGCSSAPQRNSPPVPEDRMVTRHSLVPLEGMVQLFSIILSAGRRSGRLGGIGGVGPGGAEDAGAAVVQITTRGS
jgi:hypothetical protein